MNIKDLRDAVDDLSEYGDDESIEMRAGYFRQLASDYIELTEASDDLVAGLQRALSDGNVWPCDYIGEEGCKAISTKFLENKNVDLCDRCADELVEEGKLKESDLLDKEHAPALRRIVSILNKVRR